MWYLVGNWIVLSIGHHCTWWALELQSDLLVSWLVQVVQRPQRVCQGSPPHPQVRWRPLHPWGSSSWTCSLASFIVSKENVRYKDRLYWQHTHPSSFCILSSCIFFKFILWVQFPISQKIKSSSSWQPCALLGSCSSFYYNSNYQESNYNCLSTLRKRLTNVFSFLSKTSSELNQHQKEGDYLCNRILKCFSSPVWKTLYYFHENLIHTTHVLLSTLQIHTEYEVAFYFFSIICYYPNLFIRDFHSTHN